MANTFRDLPNWGDLSKDEREMVKKTYHPNQYGNWLGDKSYSSKEAKASAKYQESIKKGGNNG